MKEQVLSIEQMQHLQDLGVDTSDASMTWMLYPYEEKQTGLSLRKWDTFKEPFRSEHCVPAFTLQDIIELLPESIMDDKNEIYKGTKYWYYLTITPSWVVSYDEGKGFLEPIKCCISESLIDVAYNMLCWCAENNYLNKDK